MGREAPSGAKNALEARKRVAEFFGEDMAAPGHHVKKVPKHRHYGAGKYS